MDAETLAVQSRFERFARDEAGGRSPLYARWAAGIADDPQTARVLARIPAGRRQPPLVFAVARLLGAPEAGYDALAAWIEAHEDEFVAETSRRSVQTNEPLRCAALLPALSTVEGPLALLEIGASAGLCLFPDRYSYRYDDGPSIDPAGGTSSVVLHSAVSGDPALRLPDVVWRAGIDLEPLDAAEPHDRRFLTTLVWPGEPGRAERITAALDIAASDPPLLLRGDATDPDVLRDAASRAPRDATLVVTTPGVLPHIPRAGRERLIATLLDLDAVWISIDPPGLLGEVSGVDPATWDGFVLSRDGNPLATVDPLGARVDWLPARG